MNVSNLLRQMREEVSDERFEGLIHGTRNAAAVGGCHGPMCRKFHRDKRRQARARKNGRPAAPSRTPELDRVIDVAIREHAKSILELRAQEVLRNIV